MPGKIDSPRNPRPTERVMVFIDGSNLYHVLTQTCGRHDLRFGKFVEKLTSGRDLVRAYYYNVRQDRAHNPAAAQEQERFFSSLNEVPYLETRLGIHKQRGVEMVEKGVDVMIATDLVSGAFKNLYDTAILVSGDGDFFPAIEAAKDLGKHVEVVAFEINLSPEAERAADVTTMLKPTFFTGLWTSRSRSTSGQAGASGRQRGGGGRRPGEAAPMPPAGTSEDEAETTGRVEQPEPEAAGRRAEEPAEKPAQRGERRRFGRRRRGGGGSGGAGNGPGGGPASGRGRSDGTEREAERASPEAVPEPQPPAPEAAVPQPPPHQRQPLRPPRLRNVGERPAPEHAAAPDEAHNGASAPEGGPGNGSSDRQMAAQPRRRLGWLRRRSPSPGSDAASGDASPAPAG